MRSLRWWGQEGNVPNLGSTERSTVVLIEIIIWDTVLIWLNEGISSSVFVLYFVVLFQNIQNFLWDFIKG